MIVNRKYPKLRNSAKGEACTLRLHPYCNENPETSVLAHLNIDSGIGQKEYDFVGVIACSACHDVIDGRLKTCDQLLPPEDIEKAKLRALRDTWIRWIERGLITIA